jgi:hypothetical protein
VPKLPFAGGGEVALFADPDGNVVGLWVRKGSSNGPAAKATAAPAKAVAPAAKPAPKVDKKAKPAKKK